MIIQIVNIGLFSQNIPITLTDNCEPVNVINSVAEYVAEVLMHKKDAFPERNNTEKGLYTSITKILTFNLYCEKSYDFFFPLKDKNPKHRVSNEHALKLISYDIILPPPERMA